MAKNLCFLNFIADEPVDSRHQYTIPVFDGEQLPESLGSSGDYILDLIHDDVESIVVKDQKQIENFIIINRINQQKINEKNAKHLMVRCFSIIRCLMPVIMQNKGSRIWLVHCLDSEVREKSYKNVMQLSLRNGFHALTRVLAMELAKKRINVNFVKMNNLKSLANFEQFLKNLRHCIPLNMTAQEIRIGE